MPPHRIVHFLFLSWRPAGMQARIWFSTAIHRLGHSARPQPLARAIPLWPLKIFGAQLAATHVIHSSRRFGEPFRTRPADAQADGRPTMKRLLLAGVGLAADRGDFGARRRHAAGRSLPPPRRADLCAVLHLERLLCRPQRRLRLRQSNGPTPSPRPRPATSTSTAALIGGTVGYNVQLSTVVVGLEGDIDWSSIKGSTTTNCVSHLRDQQHLARHGARPHRLRLRPLPALFHRRRGLRRRQRLGRAASAASAQTKVGWTGGGGLEYAFVDNWSAKLEYLYVDLGKATCNAACSGGDPFDVTFTTNIVRGGVNYKF